MSGIFNHHFAIEYCWQGTMQFLFFSPEFDSTGFDVFQPSFAKGFHRETSDRLLDLNFHELHWLKNGRQNTIWRRKHVRLALDVLWMNIFNECTNEIVDVVGGLIGQRSGLSPMSLRGENILQGCQRVCPAHFRQPTLILFWKRLLCEKKN